MKLKELKYKKLEKKENNQKSLKFHINKPLSNGYFYSWFACPFLEYTTLKEI